MKRCRAKRMDTDVSKFFIILTGWKLFYTNTKTESESQYAIVVDSRERT